jgi:hypothetical protein
MIEPAGARRRGSFLYIEKRINVAKNIQAIRGMNDYLPGETASGSALKAH